MEEVWLKIGGYEQYEISNLGKVKTVSNNASRKERILKPILTKKGYYRVGLYKNSKAKFVFIHRLVAENFINNPENKESVNHINGDKNDNTIYNLEWSTYRENMNHSVINKLSANCERNGRAKLTLLEVEAIRKDIQLNQYQLAEKYNVSQSTINRIKSNKGWKV